jgi:hypothetical protein
VNALYSTNGGVNYTAKRIPELASRTERRGYLLAASTHVND